MTTKALRPALAATTGGASDCLCKETRRQPGYDLRFVALDGCGHSSRLERTAETLHAIAGFLARR